MSRSGPKNIMRLIYLLPLLIFLCGTVSVWLQLRQANLDDALILAIKKRQIQRAVSLVDEGASARAVDSPGSPTTIKTVLAEFWDRVRGRANRGRTGTPAL